MSLLGSNRNRKHTKKSCLCNAVVGVLLGAFMIACIFIGEPKSTESIQGFLVSAGIVLAVSGWWFWRYLKFDEKDFDDPFHFGE